MPDILDWLTSLDEQVATLREQDLPTLNQQLQDLESQNEEVAEAVVRMADALGANVDRPGQARMLAWPSVERPATGGFANSEVAQLIGTFGQGPNEFDFQTGELDVANSTRVDDLSTSLNSIGEDTVRSVRFSTDVPVVWYVPGQETGQWTRQTQAVSLNDISVEKLVIKPENVTFGQLIASTEPVPPVEPAGSEVQWSYVSAGTVGSSISVGQSYEDVNWTVLPELIRGDEILSRNYLYAGNMNTLGLAIKQEGNTDIEVTVQAFMEADVPEGGLAAAGDESLIGVPGFTEDNPALVDANAEGEVWEIDIPWRVVKVQVRGRDGDADMKVQSTILTE